MIAPARGRIANALRAAAPPAIVVLVVTILLRFPPAQYSFYPQCPVDEFLHLQCPGCGATRAFAALLHGQFAEAMHFNAVITLLLPIAVAYSVLCYRSFLQRRTIRLPQPPPAVIYGGLALAAVFTVIRNLPPHSF